MRHSPKGDGALRYQGRSCVLDVDGLRGQILEEAHGSRYSIRVTQKCIMIFKRFIGGMV